MTSALDFVVSSKPGERFTTETLAFALCELEALRSIEAAARYWIKRPSPRSRDLLKQALALLPAEVGA